jgi:acetyl esterase/lipase
MTDDAGELSLEAQQHRPSERRGRVVTEVTGLSGHYGDIAFTPAVAQELRGGSTGSLPVILYMHGGGWILGNAGMHDRVAGESVGGDMTAALALMAKDRGDVRLVHQSMYYQGHGCRDGHRDVRRVRH